MPEKTDEFEALIDTSLASLEALSGEIAGTDAALARRVYQGLRVILRGG